MGNRVIAVVGVPGDPNVYYIGAASGGIFKSTDGGIHCEPIFDDQPVSSIGSLAIAPSDPNIIWAGTGETFIRSNISQGMGIYKSTDAGKTLKYMDLQKTGRIGGIDIDPHDPNIVFAAAMGHCYEPQQEQRVFRTTDGGKSWKSISSDIPRSELSYTHCIREDPVRKGLLYLGTENALYVFFNDGANWIALQNNLPHAPVHWLTIQEHINYLVVGTYGRGFWIMDDITPLQQLTPEVLKSDAYLFAPRPAYRFLSKPTYTNLPEVPCAGENPPYGASLNYYLKSTPKDEVKLTILDEEGQTIITIKGTKQSGINRIWWDLRYEGTKEVKLRTSPVGHLHVKVGPE